ncbi:nucleosome assembly protein, putative [Ichthyophthirius multifiliis]|uniref:Nucleosome assembly protein, putative n=1 Tax=Ichthyophthirius multifiliis TaxID=5932 RepID=G0QJR0_ICHMU|nr:nucleosome assembly protein, putative [Ichthyophthirius multifiliis]EGR34542.1 nucleosome assembly protein, putative [Ichthyophthirius multifiliis]|eukprot:XP_004039846.1 nucleosome assembly protein, putative [Ichthyophthirius multifiliis]
MSCVDKNCTDVHKYEKQIQEDVDNALKELPLSEKFRAVAINYHLLKKKALDDELSEKMQLLQYEYELKSKPIYEKSQELIQGKYPAEEDLKDLQKYLKEGEKDQLEALPKEQEISEFWSKAMWNNDILAQEIKQQDGPVLKSLKRIEYIPLDACKYELIFHFSENEFFKNSTLKKTFELDKEGEPLKSTGTEIEWNEGKKTTVKITKKTQKNKKTGAKRVVEKEQKIESFFNFFNNSAPIKSTEKEESENEEENVQLDRLNIDFDIYKSLVDEVIPYSLEYFLGVKTGEDEYDDEDLDDEEDIEEPPKDKKAGKGKGNSKGGATGEKQECKQQ